MMNARHVVLGSGPPGLATVEALLRRGHRVVVVNRSGRADVAAEVEVRRADLYDPATVQAVTAGATVVYQCAQPAYNEWTMKFEVLQTVILTEWRRRARN